MKESMIPENLFKDINYNHYIVEYEGDIQEEILKELKYYVTIINDRYAIISIDKDVDINMYIPYLDLLYMLSHQKCILFKKFRQLKLLKPVFCN